MLGSASICGFERDERDVAGALWVRYTARAPSVMAADAVRILCSDVCTNALGRALLLADLLADARDVRILGLKNREVWPPSRTFRVPIETLHAEHPRQYPVAARWLRERVHGARVIVHKPLGTSLGLALLAGMRPDSILVDIDDWEVGLLESTVMAGLRGPRRAWKIVSDFVKPGRFNSYVSTWSFDRILKRFPHRTVSNSFLQARFGGHLLPHVRDTNLFDPARVSGERIRARLQMNGRVWVGFIGTPRAHKGLEELIAALAMLSGPNAPGLLIAGADPSDSFAAEIVVRGKAALGGARLRAAGGFDFSELPQWVAAPDIICLPSRDTAAAHGQIPAKLFDALAMAKAVVATRVSDMADILDGCGKIVEPGNVGALARTLDELAQDADLRFQLGKAARTRAVERYSYDAGRRTLERALDRVAPQS
jgi:glycosyltransferase involved in cell wall biosynthesis